MNLPLVSVIVPNNNRDITKLKQSLTNSTYKNIELIEVNLGKERSYQRNYGIDKAKGKYLLILDSDQYIHPRLIEECLNICRGDINKSIYIQEIITTKGLFGRIRNFERQFYTGTCVDVVRFVAKEVCPYFDETLSGPEDSDWDRAVQERTFQYVLKGYPIYHEDNITLLGYIKKKLYYSKSMKHYAIKHPKDKILNLKYRCWQIFIENNKGKMLLKHPLLTLGVIFILIVRGAIWFQYLFLQPE